MHPPRIVGTRLNTIPGNVPPQTSVFYSVVLIVMRGRCIIAWTWIVHVLASASRSRRSLAKTLDRFSLSVS